MSEGEPRNMLGGLRATRTPFAAAAAPALFVFFGLYLPIASVARFPIGAGVGIAILLAVVDGAVFVLERRFAGSHGLGPAGQIREFVGVLLGAALLVWALLRLPIVVLLKSGQFWAGLCAVLLVFALSANIRRRIARREFFVAAVRRMAASTKEGPEREAIGAATRELSVEAGEAADALRGVRRWMIFFIVWFVAVLVATGWATGVAGIVEQVGICFSSVVFLAAVISLGHLREEQRLLTLGLAPRGEARFIETAVAAVLFASAGLVAAVLSLHSQFIPRTALAAIGAWLVWLFSRIPSPHGRPVGPAPPPPALLHRPPDLAERLKELAPGQGSNLLPTILTILGWSIAAAAAFGFLWLLLAPLFRLRGRRVSVAASLRSMGVNIIRRFREWVSELRSVFASLRTVLPEHAGLPPARTGRRSRASRGGRRPRLVRALLGGGNRRVAGAFRRLTRWGTGRGAVFSTSLGPQEYAAALGALAPTMSGRLKQIAELYERNFFAPDPLSPRELSEYYKMIKEVVSRGGV